MKYKLFDGTPEEKLYGIAFVMCLGILSLIIQFLVFASDITFYPHYPTDLSNQVIFMFILSLLTVIFCAMCSGYYLAKIKVENNS